MQAPQVLLSKTRCADCPAFVDSLGDGQVRFHSACGDQHTALRTTRFRDCVVLRTDLVHKPEKLTHEHIDLHIEGSKNNSQMTGQRLKLGKEYLMERDQGVHFCTAKTYGPDQLI
jgi:hypothetical protein